MFWIFSNLIINRLVFLVGSLALPYELPQGANLVLYRKLDGDGLYSFRSGALGRIAEILPREGYP